MNLSDRFIKLYKIFRTTNSIDDDLKPLKKINNLISKYRKTEKDIYRGEIISILKYNENIFNINDEFIKLILDNFIETANQIVFKQICEEI